MAYRIKAGYEEIHNKAQEKYERIEAEVAVRIDERTADLKNEINAIIDEETANVAASKESLLKIIAECEEEYEEVNDVAENNPVEEHATEEVVAEEPAIEAVEGV